jgi:hypothetical protein
VQSAFFSIDSHNLLDDILQYPEAPVQVFRPSRIEIPEKQIRLLSQLQSKASNFFTEFSLKELVKR